MSLSGEHNPFQPPSMCGPVSPDDHPLVYFGGSMSEAEGEQVNGLFKGQKATHVSGQQFVWIGVFSLLVIGYFTTDILIYDEWDQLPNVGLGILAVVGTMTAVAYQQRAGRRLVARLKQEGKGVFTNLAGRVTEQGIEYLIGDYPIRYRWDDFVGCRVGEDTVVLYLSYPKEVNFLAASLFNGPDQWQLATAAVQANVPLLTRFPKLQARKSSPRMTHIAAGIQALAQHDWQEALAEFDSALEFEPGDIQALQGRMIAAVALQDCDLALATIEDVISQGSPDPLTRRMRATVMIILERFEEALEDLDWLIDQCEDDSDLLRNRGLTFYRLGRYADALRDTSAAIELNPKDFIAFNNRGAFLLKLDRRHEAIADLEAAIRIEPSFERPKELLAEAHTHE